MLLVSYATQRLRLEEDNVRVITAKILGSRATVTFFNSISFQTTGLHLINVSRYPCRKVNTRMYDYDYTMFNMYRTH